MEYQVPQFIEVEDKIFGPFTFRQFVYLAGGAGLSVAALIYLPFIFAILVALPVAALAAALAFYRINNKPFIEVMEAGFNYLTGGRLYLWRKDTKAEGSKAPAEVAAKPSAPERLTATPRKLHELAWSLDVKDREPPQS